MPRGGSGGGGNRMEQMAAQRDAMTQKLIDALDRVGNAVGSGGTGQAAAAAGAPTVAGGGALPTGGPSASAQATPFWNAGGKSDSATGTGLNLVRQTLASTGVGAPASSLIGAPLLGVGGVAGAAALIGGNVIRNQIDSAQSIESAALGAYQNSGAFESNKAAAFRARQSAGTAQIEQEGSGYLEGFFDRWLGSANPEGYAQLRLDRARRARESRQEQERFNAITQDVEGRVEHFFSPFAVGGARPSGQQIKEISDFFQIQAEARQAIHEDVQNIVSQINATKAGSQGYQNRR